MDQDAMVSAVELRGGWDLIGALAARDFALDVAFWSRPDGEEKSALFLASPKADEIGLGPSYKLIHDILRDAPEWGIDPFAVQVLGAGNPMAVAAADLVKPRVAAGPFAVPNPKPYQGMTRYNGRRPLGGIPADGVYIYPPWRADFNPVG